MKYKIVPTVCDGCHEQCGVLVHIKDGKVVRIEGDPSNPQNEGKLCPKGFASIEMLYHPNRHKYPLKRKGEKGEGKWERISWNEALQSIADKLKEIKEKYGPLSIAAGVGDRVRALDATLGFLYAIGSPNLFHADSHFCYFPGLLAERCTYGSYITSENGPDFRYSKCIVIWGANPPASHPMRAREIMIAKRKGAKLIVVDPRFTEIASKADLYLQIRPGTDAALALGMLNVIIDEGLYDKEFVDKWCIGFDKLKKRVEEYPPKRVSEITWLSEDEIIQAARMWATNRPSTHYTRIGVQMSVNVVQAIRAISIMIAICGNLDIKGGHILSNKPKGFKSLLEIITKELRLPPELEDKRIGAKEFPLMCSSHSLATNLCHPPSVIHAILTGEPYPVKALWALNDILLALEDSEETKKALLSLEFFVGSDFFMTPTLELCDVILPPCSYLERDEVEDLFYLNFVGARQKVIEPMYETRDDRWMDFEIIKRMGLELPTEWKTIEELNDYRVKGMGITFEELKKKRYVMEPIRYKKYEETGFNTPSGKVELYSSILEKFGYDPLPSYTENPETPVSAPELAKEYPLILITGHRHIAYFHSANRQIPWLRELCPYPYLEIHPETAEKLGIKDGDWVWIETPRSKDKRVKQVAKLTEAVHPRVVAAPSHWWYPERKEPDHGCWESNINVVTSNDPPYDPISGSTPLRCGLCKVYKVEE